MAKKASQSPAPPTVSISGGPVFAWDRHWVAQTGSIQMAATWDNSESYLADPEAKFLGSRQNAHLKKTDELLARQAGCIVLTGDPGMGKTQTLGGFFDSQEAAGFLKVEFRDIPDAADFATQTTKSTAWKRWRRGGGLLTLAIDGVDEGLIKITGFVNYLTKMLRDTPLDRLQVVLACRSLEWPQSEGDALQMLWRKVPGANCGVFELCPLVERHVHIAAETVFGTETAREFTAAIRRHHLIGLATRPLTLKMLLREFAAGLGFSSTHRDLYLRAATHLCNEVDDERRRRLRNVGFVRLQLDQRRRLRVAQRIGALLLLGGRSAIWVGDKDGGSTTDLTIEEICGDAETVDGVEFTVDRAMVEAVLETPLFWARGPNRAAFYHQTFAECLAAEYLKPLALAQARPLFCRHDAHGEFVLPPLAELAAWLASSSPAFLHHLLKNDPEALLRSDVSAIKQTGRAELVDAVFAKARAEQLFDTRGLQKFFHTLKHPGLAVQLRPILRDGNANQVVRRLALDVVEQCKVTELFDDIAALLDDPDASGIHSLAARTLAHTAGNDRKDVLIGLFTAKRQSPLAAGAQLALVHGILKREFWTLTQALPHLGRFMSLYDSSGSVLAQHAVPADAEALLDAVRGWNDCFDGLNPRHALAKAGVTLGLARIHEPEVRRRLARLWWRERRAHRESPFADKPEEGEKSLEQWLHDRTLRRLFIQDVADIATKNPGDLNLFFIEDLARVEDFEWHLDQLEQGPAARKAAHAQLVRGSWNLETHAPLLGRLLRAHAASPELRDVMPWFRTWPLDDPATVKEKATFYEHEKWRKRAAEGRKPRAKPEPVWEKSLKQVDPKKPETLLTLILRLFYNGAEPKSEDLERRDVRTSPGWKHFRPRDQERILAAIRNFVLNVPGNPRHPIGGNSEWDEQAYRALYAVKDEIETCPPMAAAVRQNWLPIIFDEFSNAEEHHLEMVALGYRLDADRMRGMLRDKFIRAAAEPSGQCYTLREFVRCWDNELAQFVVTFTAAEIGNAHTVRSVADYLAEHDPAAALQLYRRFREQRTANEASFRAVASALAAQRLLEHWDDIWPDLTAEPEMAKAVLIGIDPHEQRQLLEKVQRGAEEKLANLYLYLRKLFPPSEDPRVDSGRVHTVTPRMEIGRTRDQLTTTLATWATPEAIAELGRIARKVPATDRIWVRWKQRDAIVANRRQTWTGVAPALVLQLVRKSNRRLLEDEGDLLAVTIESLERFDRALTRKPNSPKKDFWEERKGRGKVKYYQPKDEVELTGKIASWLQNDLDPDRGITLQREVQVQWNERTDIEVRAVAVQGNSVRPLEIVIEVKGCWHPKMKTAIRAQLGEKYLQNSGRTHGLYLVVWTGCDRWNDPKDTRKVRTKAKTLDQAREEIERLAKPFDGQNEPWVIRSFVLDARL